MDTILSAEELVRIAMTNSVNSEIMSRLPSLGLSQCMLTAGCLFQAVWNHQAQLPPDWGVRTTTFSTSIPNCPGRRKTRSSPQLNISFMIWASMSTSRTRHASIFGITSGLAGIVLNSIRPGTVLTAISSPAPVSGWMLKRATFTRLLVWTMWGRGFSGSIPTTPIPTCSIRRRKVIKPAGLFFGLWKPICHERCCISIRKHSVPIG